MKFFSYIFLGLFLSASLFSSSVQASDTPRKVRIGVGQAPPLFWIDYDQKAKGFYRDILDAIAEKENWDIEYVPSNCFAGQCLVSSQEVELFAGVAKTWGENLEFSNESILSDWAQIFTGKSSGIQSFLDLDEKNIGVPKGCEYYCGEDGIKSLAQKFGININFVEYDFPPEALLKLKDGSLDGVVVSRFLRTPDNLKSAIKKSPIIFSPKELYIAASLGKSSSLLKTIDRDLRQMKEDQTSIYYQSWDRWIGQKFNIVKPSWLNYVLSWGGGLLFLTLVGSLHSRYQVVKKTKEINKKNTELRSLSAMLSLTEERERRRVAELLHDNLGPCLSLAKLKLTSIKTNPGLEHNPSPITAVKEYLNEATRFTRSLTLELSPPVLNNMSCSESIEWLSEHFLKANHINVKLEKIDFPKHLDEDSKVLLLKTVRELMINIIKHSKATQVEILIKSAKGFLALTIIDNGIGFDILKVKNQQLEKKSYGLFSINERIVHLGGSFQITSSSKGTIVSIKVPFK